MTDFTENTKFIDPAYHHNFFSFPISISEIGLTSEELSVYMFNYKQAYNRDKEATEPTENNSAYFAMRSITRQTGLCLQVVSDANKVLEKAGLFRIERNYQRKNNPLYFKKKNKTSGDCQLCMNNRYYFNIPQKDDIEKFRNLVKWSRAEVAKEKIEKQILRKTLEKIRPKQIKTYLEYYYKKDNISESELEFIIKYIKIKQKLDIEITEKDRVLLDRAKKQKNGIF